MATFLDNIRAQSVLRLGSGAVKRATTRAARLFVSVLLLAVPIVVSSEHPAGAGAPAGFASSLILSGLDAGPGGNPVAFAFAPDGRVFIARKTGVIDVWDGGVRHVYLDLKNEVNSVQGRGLIAVAVDPAYATNKRVFAMFTQELNPANPDQDGPAGGKIIRVSAQAANPNAADPATRVTLLSGYQSNAREHTVGGLRFDAEGHLFATFGDASDPGVNNGEALVALDLDDLRGKLIRIDRDTGAGVAGNPYFNAAEPSSVRSKVYARGMRNPYRISVDPDNGTVYAGDVGWNTWETLKAFPVATSNPDKDRNGGWPCYEGGNGVALPQPDFQFAPVSQSTCAALYPPEQGGTGIGVASPLYGYRHDAPGGEFGSAITVGPKYTGTSNYPAQYVGKLFIGDYARDRFQTVDPATGAASDFGTPGDWGNPVDIQIGPDGNVTYLAIGATELREIVYTGTNHVPVATVSADHTQSATAPLTVSFTGHNSFDIDPSDSLTYNWDFKDGSAHATTADVSHQFVAAGSYDVTLTVSDGHPGGTVSSDLWIDVANTPPTVALTSPSPSFRYSIGSAINLGLVANDDEDGALSGTSVFTEVRLIHLGHFHPLLDFNGTSKSFTADDHDSDDTFYEVISTATDSFGRSTTTTNNILPNKVTVTLSSSPSGATIAVDGVQRTTPYSWPSIVGGRHEVGAPADFFTGGQPYAFDRWSQGTTIGEQEFFTFTTPVGGTVVNAGYTPTTPGLSISDASVVEGAVGNRAVTVDVSLSTVPTAPVTVGYATQAGIAPSATAGTDYVAKSGTLSFAAGVTTQSIVVDVIGDTVVEGDEHFGVRLLNPQGAPIVEGVANVTILDDDPSTGLKLSVGDVEVLEGNGGTRTASVTLSLSAPSPGGVSVNYATANATAIEPSDYTARSGTITFGKDKTSKTIAVAIKGDGTFEPSQSFVVNLTQPVGAVIGRATGTVRIANDDAGPALAVSDASVVEGNSGTPFVTFSIALSTPAARTVAVTFAVNHTTTNGGDIQVKTGTVTIPAGQTNQSVQVKTFGDATTEPNETFAVTLSNPVNAALADPTGVGTILNDDPAGGARVVAIGDAAINEGNSAKRLLRFTVSLSSPSASPVTVDFETGGGTAIAGTNYSAKSGSVTIPAGKTSANISIDIRGNAVPASDKTFNVTLSDASAGVTITRAIGVGTIRNDD